MTEETLADTGMSAKDIGRCKNMYALGLVYWLYDRPLEPTINFLNDFFGKKKNKPEVAEANVKALHAGHSFGETAEMFIHAVPCGQGGHPAGQVSAHHRQRGVVDRSGRCVEAQQERPGVLHVSDHAGQRHPSQPGNDEALRREDGSGRGRNRRGLCGDGVAFAGQFAVTGTSGPGLALKSEAIGLAVMTELPLVIVNVQRGGPSTGLPTKTEQSDLLQAMFGRNGDCPVVVVAPSSPADCFEVAIKASRIAMQHMVPVMILSDGYIANGAEPWLVPDASKLEAIELNKPAELGDDGVYLPYQRDDNLVRPWAVPGMKGYEHRIGGLEKADGTGNVSYVPENHQKMTDLRAAKVEKIADALPPVHLEGERTGDVLVIGWGGTYGAIRTACEHARNEGKKVSNAHLRFLNPLARDLGELIAGFDKVLVPELNTGQLRMLLRAKFLADARGVNKVQGQPFLVEEISQAINLLLSGDWPADRESLTPHRHELNVELEEANA
jgi:2-oxoglutarate ferredoxin oxidoreductase subunit alpha